MLQKALEQIVIKINGIIESYGYSGEAIRMFLAGIAVNYYCGTCYTSDEMPRFRENYCCPT